MNVLKNNFYIFNGLIKKMIFEQPIFDNFCHNFLSQTHILFLFFFSIALVFVPLPKFLCKF